MRGGGRSVGDLEVAGDDRSRCEVVHDVDPGSGIVAGADWGVEEPQPDAAAGSGWHRWGCRAGGHSDHNAQGDGGKDVSDRPADVL
jgi:hypothetical protein